MDPPTLARMGKVAGIAAALGIGLVLTGAGACGGSEQVSCLTAGGAAVCVESGGNRVTARGLLPGSEIVVRNGDEPATPHKIGQDGELPGTLAFLSFFPVTALDVVATAADGTPLQGVLAVPPR